MLNQLHLGWILNTVLEHQRESIPATEIQSRMDAKFPAIEHRMIWKKLFESMGIPS